MTGGHRTPVLLTNIPCNGAPNTGSLLDKVTHDAVRQFAVNEFLGAYALTHRSEVTLGDLDGLLCRDGAAIRSVGGRQIMDQQGELTPAGDHYLWNWIIREVAPLRAR